jgi:hypothetical protein
MDCGTGLRRLLDDAHAALAGGDAGEAEQRAKAVSALLRAERDLAEYMTAQGPSAEEDDEALRAEIRSRIARFVEAERSGAPPEVLERLARETFER